MYKRLKELRERVGLTQKEMADILKINRSTYTQYEREYNIIPCQYLLILANYFGVSIDYLFGFIDTKPIVVPNKEVDKVKAGKRLKEFRKERKITQEALAKYLNTTHSVIAEYERGRFLISTIFLYTICNKYHVSADYLLGIIDDNMTK